MEEVTVCLGCGRIVGAGAGWGCECPPPSLVPHAHGADAHATETHPSSGVGPSGVGPSSLGPSSLGASSLGPESFAPNSAKASSRNPYRDVPESSPCPRCGGRLLDTSFHDVTVLDCSACQGIFLEKYIIDRMGTEEGKHIRLAFPKRARAPEPTPVRYIECPTCHRLMNRTIFAKMSGVIVDVCKDHGVWFDAGEINAVVEFVEKGGLARAEKRAREEHDAAAASLKAAWQKEHDAFTRAGGYHSSWNHRVYRDELVIQSFFDIFVNL